MEIQGGLDVRLIFLWMAYFVLLAIACPPECTCNWKHGKQHADCSDKHLKVIPGLDSETQTLDLSDNDLREIGMRAFQNLGLINLQRINLSRCNLQEIQGNAFRGLDNLIELDLSHNFLEVVPNTTFFSSLRNLSLKNNPLRCITTHDFEYLISLIDLDLSDCKIETIEKEAFSKMGKLEYLRLNGNKLSNIQGETLFPQKLNGIELQDNVWKCDCNLRALRSWLLNFDWPHKVPVCSQPERLRNRTIVSIEEKDFACSL